MNKIDWLTVAETLTEKSKECGNSVEGRIFAGLSQALLAGLRSEHDRPKGWFE